MKNIFYLLLITITFISCSKEVSEDESATGPKLLFSTNNADLELPGGFKAILVADSVGRNRHLTIRDNGDIYVMLRSLSEEGGIAALRDNDQDGIADQFEFFGDHQGTGIEIYKDYLYYASDTSIHRYKLSDSLVPETEPELIVSGFIFERQHAVKPFTFDENGFMYVNVGAPSNACQEEDRKKESPGMDPCPLLERYGGVWRFDAEKPGQTQEADGYRYSSGIRNSVAINYSPFSKKVYVVQHGRDMLHNWFPETYSDELPAEEFFMLEDQGEYGWPYCIYDQVAGKKVLAPEYGGDGKEEGRCAQMVQPIMAFPGHYAPNDLLFYTGTQFPEKYQKGAFIAFHGSWNRDPEKGQMGYNLVYVPFEGERPAGDWEVFADGFKGPGVIEGARDALHRPTGIAEGPDGSIFVSDTNGRIYRIVYVGEQS